MKMTIREQLQMQLQQGVRSTWSKALATTELGDRRSASQSWQQMLPDTFLILNFC